MLNKIHIENFKGIKKTSIKISPITILIGANGTGKSSIGQALLIMKQSLYKNQLDNDGEIKLGNLADLFYNHDPQNNISFIFEGCCDDYSYKSQISYDINRINDFSHVYSTPLGSFKIDQRAVEEKKLIIDDNLSVIIHPRRDFWNPFNLGPSPNNQNLIDKYNEVGEQLLKIKDQLFKDLKLIRHVPSIRGTMKPSHPLEGTVYDDFLRFGELDERNRFLMSTLAYKEDLLEKISKWCVQILNAPLKFKLEPARNVMLERIKDTENKISKIKIRLVNEGFGLNQLIILLTQLALSPPKSIVIIEEPEIHLHPKAQIKLFEVLVKESLDKNLKLIISTHSEHLVYQALTKVGLKELKKSELSLNHFYLKDNICSSKELEFDKNGRLSDGLPDFFDVNIAQFKEFLEAIYKKD